MDPKGAVKGFGENRLRLGIARRIGEKAKARRRDGARVKGEKKKAAVQNSL